MQSEMPSTFQNSIIASVSGVIGGVGKAIDTKSFEIFFSPMEIIQICFYAALSAAVGYTVKRTLDFLFDKISKRFNQNNHE
jgi:hypothetical protein